MQTTVTTRKHGNKHLGGAGRRSLCTWVIIVISCILETSIWAGPTGGVCARELSLLYLVSWKQASGHFVHVGNKHLGRASWRSLCTWGIIVISGILETSIWAGRRGGVCARELSLLYLVSWKQASGQSVLEEFVHVSYHCYIWYLGNKHLGGASWRSSCTWVIIVKYLVSWKQASGRGVVEEFVQVSYHCYIRDLGNKHLGGANRRSLCTWVVIVISGILETSIWAGPTGGVCARELSLLYLVSWKQASGRCVMEEFVHVSYQNDIWILDPQLNC